MKNLISLFIGFGIILSVPAFSADNWHFECVNPASPGARDGARMVYDSVNDKLLFFGRYFPYDFYSSADLWTWTPSSGWTLEAVSDTPSMTRRGFGSFAYDAARSEAVWYGGWFAGFDQHQTWTWDGSDWTQQNPASAPPDTDPSSGYPMAYDSVRNVCVLVVEDKTWEWDGTTWSQIPTTVLPGADSGSAMAYDSHRQRMVLFASSFYNPDSRTLEYNGMDWELKSPATVIQRHSYSTMFYDSVRQNTIMFGGYFTTGTSYVCNDTYRWDGTDWTLLTPAQSPPPGANYSSAFHQGLGTGMIISGFQSNEPFYSFESGMWSWDGITWTPISPGARPSQRLFAAMSWDSDQQRIVLFGGSSSLNEPFFTDTWEFDGTEWTLMTPSVHPPAEPADMVYHSGAGVTFLVTGTTPAQTWTWNGMDWSQLTTSAVAGGSYPQIAYDGAGARMMLVSGNETYIWSGTDWNIVSGSGTPVLQGYDLTYDAELNRFVMLVQAESPGLADTWLFDTGIWVNSGLTVPLNYPQLAWDEVTRKAVAIGGYFGIAPNEEIWTFDGTGWTGSPTVELGGPEGRAYLALCAADNGLYFFGGDSQGCSFNELWTITWEKAVPALDAWGLLILVIALSASLIRTD